MEYDMFKHTLSLPLLTCLCSELTVIMNDDSLAVGMCLWKSSEDLPSVTLRSL